MRLQTEGETESLEDALAKANAEAIRVASQKVSFVHDMGDDELRKLAREKLSMALQAISPEHQPELTRKLCAELMDRLDGKPAQSVQLDATVRKFTVEATISYIMPSQVESLIIDHVDKSEVIDNE